jgi:hypothetical protein
MQCYDFLERGPCIHTLTTLIIPFSEGGLAARGNSMIVILNFFAL